MDHLLVLLLGLLQYVALSQGRALGSFDSFGALFDAQTYFPPQICSAFCPKSRTLLCPLICPDNSPSSPARPGSMGQRPSINGMMPAQPMQTAAPAPTPAPTPAPAPASSAAPTSAPAPASAPASVPTTAPAAIPAQTPAPAAPTPAPEPTQPPAPATSSTPLPVAEAGDVTAAPAAAAETPATL